MGLKPINHGFDHRPGGTDPIPDTDYVSWNTPGWNVNLPLWGNSAGLNFAGTVDSTRIHNWKLTHTAATGPDSMVLGPFNCYPGFYVLAISAAVGPTYGTVVFDVAGAYPLTFDWFGAGPAPGDWVNIATFDFTAGSPAVYNNYIVPGPSTPYAPTAGYDGTNSFAAFYMYGGVQQDGINNIYTMAANTSNTPLSGGAQLLQADAVTPAGGGYYFLRITCTGLIEFSDMLLLNGGFPI